MAWRAPKGFQIGQNRFGHYNIVRVIHDGEKAMVYEGRHQTDGRLAAIKAYKFDYNRTALSLRKKYGIKGEGEVGMELNPPQGTPSEQHPVVITYEYGTEFGKSNTNEYIVQEFIEGVALKHLIGCSHPMLAKHKTSIIRQVCQGLQYIHGRGMIHRDFCSDNVIVSSAGRCKIIDLGFTVPKGLKFEERGGTPSYMSPEQINADTLLFTTDIYSLGVVLYETLTGRLPFISGVTGDSPRELQKRRMELMEKHLREKPAPPSQLAPSVPKALDAFVLKCLEKKPQDRFQDMKTVLAALG
ncbi:MAG: serine/threonine protein kinase [Planctomycetes bacterium]|nr:serine/threonine protein kinase [Planctomycetota bacterium]